MTQNRIVFFLISMSVLMVFSTAVPAVPGEVVTKETRSWAKEVLAKEKTGAPQISKNSMGVLYFRNKTGKSEFDKLQKGLAVMLITDLAQLKRIQLVERIKM